MQGQDWQKKIGKREIADGLRPGVGFNEKAAAA
jgi:hypothetical protein